MWKYRCLWDWYGNLEKEEWIREIMWVWLSVVREMGIVATWLNQTWRGSFHHLWQEWHLYSGAYILWYLNLECQLIRISPYYSNSTVHYWMIYPLCWTIYHIRVMGRQNQFWMIYPTAWTIYKFRVNKLYRVFYN